MNKDMPMKCATPMKMTIASIVWAKAKGFCPTKNPPEKGGLILNI
jgi:hypothetical protein